jgi:hypothetical protein
MASTPDELIAGFPHSSLPKVTGKPTFKDLKVIRRLLNTNAMSVSSYVGGGPHGHLGIIMTNKEYFAIAADVFPVPKNPGASAEVVPGMTATVIARTTQLHREATQVYHTYHNVDQAIKTLIIEAFDNAYLTSLSDEIMGYANFTSLQLLTHILTYYAMIALLNSRRTTSASTHRMILINRSRRSSSKSKTLEPLRSQVDNRTAMQ